MYLFLLPIVLLYGGTDAAQCAHGWVMYKDELCIKMFNTYVGYEEAKNICEAQADEMATSSLVTVKEADMQQFLTTYTQGNFDNLWLGGKYDTQTFQFRWVDGEPLTYSHWQEDYPRNFTEADTCIELKPINSKRAANQGGSWSNVLCQKRNQVMCQKTVSWDSGDIIREMIRIRKELWATQDELHLSVVELAKTKQDLLTTRQEVRTNAIEINRTREELTKELTALRVDQSATSQELAATRADLAATINLLTTTREELRLKGLEIVKTQQDLAAVSTRVVPVGSIYIEYNNQPSPRTLWPTLTWQDITSTYAGIFFRAFGGGSAGWGSVQTECVPRVTQINYAERVPRGSRYPKTQTLPANGWSEYADAGEHHYPGESGTQYFNEGLRLHTTNCEVRPRNQAIRIWKRTA